MKCIALGNECNEGECVRAPLASDKSSHLIDIGRDKLGMFEPNAHRLVNSFAGVLATADRGWYCGHH